MQKRHLLLLSIGTLSIGFGLALGWYRLSANDLAALADKGRPSAGAAVPVANLSKSANEQTPPPMAAANDIAALREEVAALRAELASLRHPGNTLAPSSDAASAASTEKNVRDPATRAEAERNRRQQMAAVESAFRNEPNDPNWSPRATTLIQQALSSNDATRAGIGDIECQSRTCRVEIRDDGSSQMGKFMPMFAQQVSQSFPTIIADRVEQGNGGATMVLYLSRNNPQPGS